MKNDHTETKWILEPISEDEEEQVAAATQRRRAQVQSNGAWKRGWSWTKKGLKELPPAAARAAIGQRCLIITDDVEKGASGTVVGYTKQQVRVAILCQGGKTQVKLKELASLVMLDESVMAYNDATGTLWVGKTDNNKDH